MTLPPRNAEPVAPPEGGWTLDSLRTLGVPQRDPLGFAYVQALAHRTAAQPGPVRRLLEARLAQALADCVQRFGRPPPGADAVHARPPAPPAPSPLAGLLRRLDSASSGATVAGAVGRDAPAPPAGELKALQAFKRRWSRLSADGQVARSAAQLPANPGPLNSQLLALRALQQMQALSPAYLQHFVAQVEALLWLDGASAAPLPGKPARRDGLRKPKPGSRPG